MAPLRSGQQAACGWPGRAAVGGGGSSVLLLGYVSRAERCLRACAAWWAWTVAQEAVSRETAVGGLVGAGHGRRWCGRRWAGRWAGRARLIS